MLLLTIGRKVCIASTVVKEKKKLHEKHLIGKEKVAPSLPEDGMIPLLEITNNYKTLLEVYNSAKLQVAESICKINKNEHTKKKLRKKVTYNSIKNNLIFWNTFNKTSQNLHFENYKILLTKIKDLNE